MAKILDGVAHRVFRAADGVFDLALHFVGLAFGLELGIAHHLADVRTLTLRTLHGAFGLIGHAFCTILIHRSLLLGFRRHNLGGGGEVPNENI